MPIRLVMISRRYWPLVGGSEHALAHLARGVQAQEASVTLLTPRWQHDWPDHLDDQGVQVLRLNEAPRRFWTRRRWQRRLKQWLLEHRANYDLVFVAGLAEEAKAARQASHITGIPYVVRPEEWNDVPQGPFRRSMRKVLQGAAAATADGPALCAALTAAGYPRERIQEIPDGVPPAADQSDEAKKAARQELAEADSSLLLEEGALLALYAGPLTLKPELGLRRLIEAWTKVVEEVPQARLWIVGVDSNKTRLEAHLRSTSMDRYVTVVGPFDALESFYQAADLFVHPGTPQKVSFTLREAMAAGLPCVVADSRTSRRVVEPGWNGLLAPGYKSESLAEAIVKLLKDQKLAKKMGDAAREYSSDAFALAKVAQQHLELWSRICQQGK